MKIKPVSSFQKSSNQWAQITGKLKENVYKGIGQKVWEPTACEFGNLTFTSLSPLCSHEISSLTTRLLYHFLLLETTFINWSDDRWASSSPNIFSSSTSTILHLPVVAWINKITVFI